MNLISINKASIDKISLLLRTEYLNNAPDRERRALLLVSTINDYLKEHKLIKESFVSQGYHFHKKLVGDIDFQFLPKYSAKKVLEHKTENGEDERQIYYVNRNYLFRFEYNPNKGNLEEIEDFLRFISNRYKVNVNGIKISRVDIAIDYAMNIDLSLISNTGNRLTRIISNHNGIQSVYFGSGNSKNQIRIYNKKEEIEAKQKEKCEHEYLYRVEFQYRADFPLNIDTFDNVFKKLSFFDSIEKTGDNYLDLVLFKAKHCGLKTVLNEFPKYQRHRLNKQLQDILACKNFEHPSKIFDRDIQRVWYDWKNKFLSIFLPDSERVLLY